jgi:protein tyrosine phosphatase
VSPFKISDTSKNESWGPVHHYQYTDWPDFGVPDSCKSIINLIEEVEEKVSELNGKFFLGKIVQGLRIKKATATTK